VVLLSATAALLMLFDLEVIAGSPEIPEVVFRRDEALFTSFPCD